MIQVVGPSKIEPLLIELGATIRGGKWTLTSLPDSARKILELEGATIEGMKYMCWNIWFPNIYQITKDPRCTVSFNTLSKRAVDLTVLDSVVVGRAKSKLSEPRKLHGSYKVEFRGVCYPSESAIAREFGIDPIKFRSRRQLGWSIEECVSK